MMPNKPKITENNRKYPKTTEKNPKEPKRTGKKLLNTEKNREEPKIFFQILLYTEKNREDHFFIPRRTEKTSALYREDPRRPEKIRPKTCTYVM